MSALPCGVSDRISALSSGVSDYRNSALSSGVSVRMSELSCGVSDKFLQYLLKCR